MMLICLLNLASDAQDSLVSYLHSVKKDFNNCEDIIADSISNKYDLILIGETHGFRDNYKVALKLINEYKEDTNFKYILSETDWLTSKKLNSYLLKGDSLKIKQYLNNFKTSPAWCKEKYNFYRQIIETNKNHERKIQFLGVDLPAHGIRKSLERLIEISEKYQRDSTLSSLKRKKRLNQEQKKYLQNLKKNIENKAYSESDAFEFKFLVDNILNYQKAVSSAQYSDWDKLRDSCVYINYKQLVSHLHLKGQKMIGIWGSNHTLQSETNGIKWFASRLKNDLHLKVYTYRLYYFNSKCMLSEQWLPNLFKLMRSKKKLYYSVKLQNDDSWVTGAKFKIDILKKLSPKHSISFYDLTVLGSPFFNHPYLENNYMEADWVTTDLFQTAIVIRNSEPTEPLGLNRK